MASADKRRLFTIANFVSASRFVFIPFIVYCLASGARWVAFILILISYFTDLLDGYLARKMHQESYYGKIIDPLTDKLNLGAIVITLFFTDAFPLWCVLVVVLRDLLILVGSLVLIKKIDAVFPSNIPGKITGFIFGVMVCVYVLRIEWPKTYLLWLIAGLLVVSFAAYVRVYIRNVRRA